MQDSLAIINRVIKEHQAIRRHVRLVGDSLSDREAILSLQSTRTDWIPVQMETLVEKQNKLQQAIRPLEEGLNNHFAFEEKTLPSILGEVFMRALIIDHHEIQKIIMEAKTVAADTKLKGLSREELISTESHIQQVIENIGRQVEDHARREEIVLEMFKRGLEEK